MFISLIPAPSFRLRKKTEEMRCHTAQLRGINAHMAMLAEILSSRVRAEILRILFGPDTVELHNREIVRRANLSESAVRQELKNLAGLGLLDRRRESNRTYYTANRNHPLFAEIRGLVLKTSGLADVLRGRLASEGVDLAFVFGSVAAGRETA